MKFTNDKSSYPSSVTFYVLHLPVLLLVLSVFSISAFVTSRVANKATGGKETIKGKDEPVVGDEDSDDEEENENEDKDEDEDKDKDDDEDRDEDEDENENEDKDENEDDERDEDESEDSSKSKTQERVQNSDGSYSLIKQEIEDDKVKTETKTYDASGNLISE